MGEKKKYLGLNGTTLQVAVGVIAGLDFFLFGYDQGVMGGLLTLNSFVKQFPQIDNNQADLEAMGITSPEAVTHRASVQAIAVASYNLGCFLGAITTIWVGDILGRRRTIFVGSSIMVIGATIMSSAFSLPQFIVGRIITGFGNGMNTSTIPTWQSECSKSHRRGMLVMIEGALITGGVCFSYWLDFGFYYLDPSSVSWRFPLAFQIFFALIIIAFIFTLPESPRWLILKGKEHEAMNVLAALNGEEPESEYVMNEFKAIKDVVLEMSKGSFSDLFTMDENRHFHRTALAYINQFFQQICGINLITYYASFIYQTYVGLSPFLSRLIAAANGTEYFLASWIAVFTIEKFGRRQLMLFGSVGQTLSMVVLAIVNYLASQNKATGGDNQGPGVAAVLFLFVFNTFFAVGWLGMTWLYPAEIVPLRIRAPANALSTSANWLFNFLIVMISPVMFASIGYQTYIVFACINAAIVPSVWFFYPETAYRSLEEMDTIFHKTTSIWDVVGVAKREPRRYGKDGELLIAFDETDAARRRSSVAPGAQGRKQGGVNGLVGGNGVNGTNGVRKADADEVEDVEKRASGSE